VTGRRGLRFAALFAVLVVLVAAGVWVAVVRTDQLRVTAYFSRAVGVYPGSDVQVLGVKVGSVDSVTPKGDQVEVVLSIDADAPVAPNTGAVVIAPSVVADRSVQLTTLRHGGPRIADNAIIPVDRTATPVELDELYGSLDKLTTALGPNGANADGALSDLLDTGANTLRGNGTAFNETIRNFAEVAKTLTGSQDNLFGTIDELQKFTAMLAGNDRAVRDVTGNLGRVAATLSDNKEELAGALNTLGAALADIQAFIRDNRAALKSNVDKLAGITQVLVNDRESLSEALDVAPLAVTNLENAFDPASGTLQSRANLLEYESAPPGAAARLPLPASGPVLVAPKQGAR
jgi:phospholipid/cholesterol/gamma-HCH transport system substrate-binding protein